MKTSNGGTSTALPWAGERKLVLGALFLAASCGAVIACGGGSSAPAPAKVAAGGAKEQSKWPADDRSLCEWKNTPELEVSETAGPGAIKPNVRRVYKDIGEGENRHKVLVCREIDTNLDGIKDVVRTFNAKGEATKENADSNFDGKLDIWATYVNGRMSEEDIDTNFDGAADVWKYYVDGKLSRIKRDRNFDGKPDVWEIYQQRSPRAHGARRHVRRPRRSLGPRRVGPGGVPAAAAGGGRRRSDLGRRRSEPRRLAGRGDRSGRGDEVGGPGARAGWPSRDSRRFWRAAVLRRVAPPSG